MVLLPGRDIMGGSPGGTPIYTQSSSKGLDPKESRQVEKRT